MEELFSLYEFASSSLQSIKGIEPSTYGISLIVGASLSLFYIMGKGEIDNYNFRKRNGANRSKLENKF